MDSNPNNSSNQLNFENIVSSVRGWVKCPFCQGNKVVLSIGGVETRCNACGKIESYIKKYWIGPFRHYFITPFLTYLVPITIALFFVMTLTAFNDSAPAKIAGAVSLFGSIFVALKFKLDQASYHKDLFDRRYAIFLIINDVLTAWCAEAKSTNEMIGKISNDLMRRSYFLFGEHTYDFICEFRRALIWTETSENEIDDVKFREEIRLSRNFLISFVDGQKLADKFPELKINYY
jgi:hypothetical protein